MLAGTGAYFCGPTVVFVLLAIMAIATIVSVLRFPAGAINHEVARGLEEPCHCLAHSAISVIWTIRSPPSRREGGDPGGGSNGWRNNSASGSERPRCATERNLLPSWSNRAPSAVLASCPTASVIRRQVAAPSSSPASASSLARAVVSSSALSP